VSIVPLAPSGLLASSTSDSQINLTWTNYSHVATAVVVERSDDEGQTWATVGSLDPDAATFQDANLDEGKTYQYRVHAGTSTARSTEGPATATTRPISASNLHAVAISSTQIDLDWDDNSDTETGYRVLRSGPQGPSYPISTEMKKGGPREERDN
jgi:titin